MMLRHASALFSMGFAQDESVAVRCSILEIFIATHLASVKYDCVSYETTRPVKTRQLAAAYLFFFNQFASDTVFAIFFKTNVNTYVFFRQARL